MVRNTAAAVGMLAVLITTMTIAPVVDAAAQAAPTTTIVSTSGVPHGDVADYRVAPEWRQGMPKGANWAWRTFMRDVVAQVTASDPDLVVHSGDMVEGRWYKYVDRHRMFGSRATEWQRRRMVRRAGDTIYPWLARWWEDHDVLWGMGDHEIGDMGATGVIPPTSFKYRAHDDWTGVWSKHFGKARRARRVGNVGVLMLDPFVQWRSGVHALINRRDRRWIADRVAAWRDAGVDWVLVASEVPAIGPNRERRSSGVLLRNGGRVWDLLQSLGVDVLLAGEFHADTARSAGGATPLQVVHGGRHMRSSWLQIDAYGADRLELTLWQSRGAAAGRGEIWATTYQRLNNGPRAGRPTVTGRATVHADGRLTGREGALAEAR